MQEMSPALCSNPIKKTKSLIMKNTHVLNCHVGKAVQLAHTVSRCCWEQLPGCRWLPRPLDRSRRERRFQFVNKQAARSQAQLDRRADRRCGDIATIETGRTENKRLRLWGQED